MVDCKPLLNGFTVRSGAASPPVMLDVGFNLVEIEAGAGHSSTSHLNLSRFGHRNH